MRKPRWRIMLLTLAGLAIIGLIASDLFGPRRRVQEILTKLHEEQQPTTRQALTQHYATKTGSRPDRLVAWLTAIVPVSTPEYMHDYEAALRADRAGDDHLAVDEFLARHATVVQSLKQAAKDPGPVHYPFDLAAGLEMNLEVLVQLKRATRLLNLEMQAAARHGDAVRFVESARTALVAAATLHSAPILAAHEAYCEIIDTSAHTIFRGLRAVDLDKQQCQRLIATAHASQHPSNLATALQGERAIAIGYFLEPQRLPSFYRDTVASNSARYFDLDYYLRHMQRGIDAVDRPLHEGWQDAVRLQQELSETSGRQGIIGRWICRRRVLSLLLLPKFETVAEMNANTEFALHALPIAVAMSVFAREQGRLPTTLIELQQTDLETPTEFAGAPIDFLTTPEQCQISSRALGSMDDRPRLRIEFPLQRKQPR